LAENLHSDNRFSRCTHLLDHAHHRVGISVHVRSYWIQANEV
jgi:hypothetical protein